MCSYSSYTLMFWGQNWYKREFLGKYNLQNTPLQKECRNVGKMDVDIRENS